MNDSFKIKGSFTLKVFGEDGHLKFYQRLQNLVTNAGLAAIASRINGNGAEAVFASIALGTGTTAEDVTDTALETEIVDSGLERASATASRVTGSVTNDTARFAKTFSVTGSKAITEIGILNDASAGTLLCHKVFAAVNVVNGDSLVVTYDLAGS